MQVVVKEPNKAAEVRQLDVGTSYECLKAMQALVGGYVQSVQVTEDISILCDEEGLYKIPTPLDNCGFVGTIVFVQNGEENWVSLTEENARKAIAYCERYKDVPHPDKSGGFSFLTGEEEIAAYQRQCQEATRAATEEWKVL